MKQWCALYVFLCSFKTNQFNSFFNIEDTNDIPVLSGPSYPFMPEYVANVCVVQKLLHNVKPNKASGPDHIPCRVLKEAARDWLQH